MPETFTAIATRALSDDFDVGLITKAKTYAKEAVRELYRTTRLHRGDIPMTLHNLTTNATQFVVASIYGSAAGVQVESIVFADNGGDLLPMDFADLLRVRGANPNARGRPEFFAVSSTTGDPTGTEATTLEIWPTADANYQVFVVGALEPDITLFDDGDTVPLPDAWLKLVYYYTRANLFADDTDQDGFSMWDTRWINGCSAMRSDLQRTVGNRIIPGTWAGMGSARPSFNYKGQIFS